MKFKDEVDEVTQKRTSKILCFERRVEANLYRRPLFYIMIVLGVVLATIIIIGAWNQDLLVESNIILALIGFSLALVLDIYFYFRANQIDICEKE